MTVNVSFQLTAKKKVFLWFKKTYDFGSYRGDKDIVEKILSLQSVGFSNFHITPNISQSDRIVG